MTQASMKHPGFDFLHKAGLVLLVFQFAVAARLIMEHGLEGPTNSFFILIMGTALLLAPLQRLAGRRDGCAAPGWVVASRAVALLLFAIGSLAIAFQRFLPAAGPDLVVRAVFSLMWIIIALKGAAAGKFKPNGAFGLRVYWTLHSRLAWERAHRALGRILFWGGLIGLGASFVVPPLMSVKMWFGVLAAAAIVALFESWRSWRVDPERH